VFSDKTSIKAIITGLIFYLVVATVAMIVVVQLWMPAGITDTQQLTGMAETDSTLLLWQNILGTVLGVAAGFITCLVSGRKGLKSTLILGVLLTLYGVLGIYLHPTHPFIVQVAKIVAPIPLTLIGGWLCLRLMPRVKADA